MVIPLGRNTDCVELCKIIQKLINNFTKESNDVKDIGLSINIVEISDGGDQHIPKLEYRPLS